MAHSLATAVAAGASHILVPTAETAWSITLSGPASVNVDEGSRSWNNGVFASNSDLTFSASIGTVEPYRTSSSGGTWGWSYVTTNGPSESQTVTITARDSAGNTNEVSFPLVVRNVAPSYAFLQPNGPGPYKAGVPVTTVATFTDPGTGDTHTCTVIWQNGSAVTTTPVAKGLRTCEQTHTFETAGLKTLLLTVKDSDGAQVSDVRHVLVTDGPTEVRWDPPSPIVYGTPLSVTQLNAISWIPGWFTYDPPLGTVLHAGLHTLTARFRAVDSTIYQVTTKTVTIQVTPASPGLSWETPAAIPYGTPLSSAQLNATATVPGTFKYSQKKGAIPDIGLHMLTVVFTPDSSDYLEVMMSVNLTVTRAKPVITWKTPDSIEPADALGDAQLNATASVPGAFIYKPAAGTRLTAGDHKLTATFNPDDSKRYETATAQVVLHVGTPALTQVSAASFQRMGLAPGALFSLFGAGLADHAESAGAPLPTTLAGVTITLTDSTGAQFLAPLLYVSPTQVNFLAPEGLAAGAVQLSLSRATGSALTLATTLSAVAPGLFSASSDGSGIATGNALRVTESGERFESSLSTCTQSGCTAVPIDLGAETDKVYVSLYGTGIRHRSTESAVAVTIGGIPATVQYAGEQSQFAGLDQINILLPRALAGKGAVAVVITADGTPCNPVMISVL